MDYAKIVYQIGRSLSQREYDESERTAIANFLTAIVELYPSFSQLVVKDNYSSTEFIKQSNQSLSKTLQKIGRRLDTFTLSPEGQMYCIDLIHGTPYRYKSDYKINRYFYTMEFRRNEPYLLGEPSDDYLCFTAVEDDCEISVYNNSNYGTPSIYFQRLELEYSKDKNVWKNWEKEQYCFKPIIINTNESVWIRGDNDTFRQIFSYSKKVKVSGNIMSLLDKQCRKFSIQTTSCFSRVFVGSYGYYLSDGEYIIINQRENLLTIPKLPALKLSTDCYWGMFAYNQQISGVLELPAISVKPSVIEGELGGLCYSGMFNTRISPKHTDFQHFGVIDINNKSIPEYDSVEKIINSITSFYVDGYYSSLYYPLTLVINKSLPITLSSSRLSTAINYEQNNFAYSDAIINYGILFSPITIYDKSIVDETIEDNSNKDYLCFTFEGMTITDCPYENLFSLKFVCANNSYFSNPTNFYIPNLEYSYDKRTWHKWKPLQEIPKYQFQYNLQPIIIRKNNEKVYIRGNNYYKNNDNKIITRFSTQNYYWVFSLETKKNRENINVYSSGNIMSLLDKNCELITFHEPVISYYNNSYSFVFNNLFRNFDCLVTPPKLPATKLSYGCYTSMFQGCKKLRYCPELPATTGFIEYINMFAECRSLTETIEFPEYETDELDFRGMYKGCTSLTTIRNFPDVAEYCKTTPDFNFYFDSMFQNCSSLEEIPTIPFYMNARGQYYGRQGIRGMFAECINIKKASIKLIEYDKDVNDKHCFYLYPKINFMSCCFHNVELNEINIICPNDILPNDIKMRKLLYLMLTKYKYEKSFFNTSTLPSHIPRNTNTSLGSDYNASQITADERFDILFNQMPYGYNNQYDSYMYFFLTHYGYCDNKYIGQEISSYYFYENFYDFYDYDCYSQIKEKYEGEINYIPNKFVDVKISGVNTGLVNINIDQIKKDEN